MAWQTSCQSTPNCQEPQKLRQDASYYANSLSHTIQLLLIAVEAEPGRRRRSIDSAGAPGARQLVANQPLRVQAPWKACSQKKRSLNIPQAREAADRIARRILEANVSSRGTSHLPALQAFTGNRAAFPAWVGAQKRMQGRRSHPAPSPPKPFRSKLSLKTFWGPNPIQFL